MAMMVEWRVAPRSVGDRRLAAGRVVKSSNQATAVIERGFKEEKQSEYPSSFAADGQRRGQSLA
jgi:hypothetical protein